jgi:V/A-type H+-transporting ATPase subunit I
MIALPIFAAMLISDGGYGAVLLLGLLLPYRKVSKVLGAEFTRLLIVVGAVALVWGFLCGSFFGCVLYDPPIPVDLSAQSRALLMKISFVMGAIHLSIAQLWQGVALYPNLRFLNRVGWAVFIWGMLGVVRFFVLDASVGWDTPWPYLLIAGAALAILFACPSRNIAKMLGLGLADFPLSMLSAFSDVISYVRLMAVGLASSVLAGNFNELALGLGHWPLVVAVLLFGHSLNLGLALIALFAHGVRLNMLEFSNNLGMQWTGYPYNPFLKQTIQEH